ncbi:hypothetical protein LVQ78_19510 [Buttiauxella sp. A2-C2_NF]|uniref:hypothetical protein n=1 Tax=Buttiauxella ferragutiae TaxID=82989 RepID=UPI001E3EECAA|nr:hypothetical protein [Buttiauxella ferragutiae]MCE0828213.1 hypothetical protein [Buttiauxella ferragutiae]
MELLNTYERRDEAEIAYSKIRGEKRLASERDGTATIYNLFGSPTWGNFHKLRLFSLVELEYILSVRDTKEIYDTERHSEIIETLHYISKKYAISIPAHWFPR